ncbi:MAG: hypothetical protein RSC73_04105 [Ruthenibacterium sp.]
MNTWKPVKKELVIVLCAVMVLGIFLFAALLCGSLRREKSLNPQDYTEAAPEKFTYHVTATPAGKSIEYSGYACVIGERFETVDLRVVLYHAASESYLCLPTEMVLRTDATEEIADGINYSFGGFSAFVRNKSLESPPQEYEICFAYRVNGHNALIHTGQTAEVLV